MVDDRSDTGRTAVLTRAVGDEFMGSAQHFFVHFIQAQRKAKSGGDAFVDVDGGERRLWIVAGAHCGRGLQSRIIIRRSLQIPHFGALDIHPNIAGITHEVDGSDIIDGVTETVEGAACAHA